MPGPSTGRRLPPTGSGGGGQQHHAEGGQQGGQHQPAQALPAAVAEALQGGRGRRGVSLPAGHRSPTAQRRSLSGPSSGQARCRTGQPAASETAAAARASPFGEQQQRRRRRARWGTASSSGRRKPAAASGPKARGRRRWSGRSAARRRRTTAWRRGWRPAPLSCGSANSARQWAGSAQRPPVPRRRGAAADRSPPSPPSQQDQWVP